VTPSAPLAAAAATVSRVFESLGERACLIGGLAVQRWGQPRATQDVDVTVLVPFGSEGPLVDSVLAHFEARHPDARAFALRHRVLLVSAPNHVNVDISLAGLPFEAEVLDRATPWRVVDGASLVTCSAEDLVIYKLIAARPQDLADVDSVVRRQFGRLDIERIRRWGHEFADMKEEPGLVAPFEAALVRAGRERR
jgi:hypothetical protein